MKLFSHKIRRTTTARRRRARGARRGRRTRTKRTARGARPTRTRLTLLLTDPERYFARGKLLLTETERYFFKRSSSQSDAVSSSKEEARGLRRMLILTETTLLSGARLRPIEAARVLLSERRRLLLTETPLIRKPPAPLGPP